MPSLLGLLQEANLSLSIQSIPSIILHDWERNPILRSNGEAGQTMPYPNTV